MSENPYRPPSSTQASPPVQTGRGQVRFEEYEAQIIQTMSKGMKVAAVLGMAAALLLVLLLVVTGVVALRVAGLLGQGSLSSGLLGGPVLVMALLVVPIGLAAVWLFQASRAFPRSITEQTTDGLARGFRKLQLYLVVVGVYSILSLLGSLLAALGLGAARGLR